MNMNINIENYYKIKVSMSSDPGLSCFDISSSAESICFGEVGGIIRQWADREPFKVHDYSAPTQIVDRTPPVPPIKISFSLLVIFTYHLTIFMKYLLGLLLMSLL